MNGEYYDTMEIDEDFDQDDESYNEEEVDEMLDALVDSTDYAERKRRRPKRSKRGKPVPAAQGKSAYRQPAAGANVTQKQFKEALDRVGADIKRNGDGIKTINTRLVSLGGRVDGVVSVATTHSREIAKFEKRMKVDGALELVEALNGGQLNAFQLLKGAVKSGFLGDGKGALSNPAVVGGIGLVLRNPGIIGNIGGGGVPAVP